MDEDFNVCALLLKPICLDISDFRNKVSTQIVEEALEKAKRLYKNIGHMNG